MSGERANTSATATPRNFSVKLCSTPEERQRCMTIRNIVFCQEQGYDPAIEVDEKDPLSDHFLLTETKEDGTLEDVGTLRCYASPPDLLKLGRFAVHSRYRGTGAGRFLEEEFVKHLANRKPAPRCQEITEGKTQVEVVAFSQCIAVGFYTRLGWKTQGEEFLEEGQPHIKIVKTIKLD
ncbi:hypothetical protein JCM16303_006246 [Sporobolomyces ruberrimus]